MRIIGLDGSAPNNTVMSPTERELEELEIKKQLFLMFELPYVRDYYLTIDDTKKIKYKGKVKSRRRI